MSAKNKKSLKLIIAALVVALSSVFLPTMGAYAEMQGNGEEKAKNYLYATAAYQCARSASEGNFENFNEFVTIGQSISSIFTNSFKQTKVSIGKWLGDDDGKITCGDAIDKAAAAIGITSITAEDMDFGGFLYQVYSLFSEPIEYLNCVYPITMDADAEDVFMNADGNDWIEFWWPQGYVDDLASEGGIKDKTSTTPLYFGFGQNGQFVKVGYSTGQSLDSELNPNLAENVSTAWSNVSTNIMPDQREDGALNTFCKDLISSPFIKIFSRVEQVCSTSANGPNSGQSCQNETTYGNIRFAKDVAGSDGVYSNYFWRTGYYTNYHLGDNQKKAIYDNHFTRVANPQPVTGLYGRIIQSGSTGNTAEWARSADGLNASVGMSSRLKRNISDLLFGGNYLAGSMISPDDYLDAHPEIKYVIMGRYLFNGDNGLARGRNCGGFSIRSDDPNYDPSNTYWNTAQSYNVTTQAYPTTTIGHKDPFITKIGGDAGLDEGDASLTAAWKPGGGEENCKDIAEAFNSITLSGGNHGGTLRAVFGYINPITIDSGGSVPVTPYNPANPGNVETAEVNCYTHAGALGWILCPIVESGSQFVSDVYDKFIEPQLVLDSGLFTNYAQGGNQGGQETYEAWQTFRNLANIAFVAVFLFVIFSQLTGFGIDNYGIKKILPKLIVAAIIINASYYICQIAIDAANIAGYGIKNIMGTVGQVPADSEFAIHDGGHTLASIGSNLGIVALITALAAPAVLGQGIGILISVFTALIGVVVAILTLFVVLAARKALSLVLVVISPLAFLCYMLPNTKKLFNKWLDALKGTLLAFPICAAMVFGGQAVSRIVILASSEVEGTPFFMTLIAAATAVAPIFLIPSTLKKSMGAVSAVIDKASHGVNRFAKGRWQGSKTAKNMKESGAQWADRRASGLKFDEKGNFVGFTKRGQRQNERYKDRKGSLAARRLQAQRLAALQQNNASLANADKFGSEEYLMNIQSGHLEDEDKKRIANIEAAYRRGDKTNANGDKFNMNDNKSRGATGLYAAMKHAANEGNMDDVLALSNIAAQTEDGRDIIASLFDGFDIDTQNKLSSHLIKNYGKTFKDNRRTFHDKMASIASGGDGSDAKVNSASLKGALINSMDKEEYEAVQARAEELSNKGSHRDATEEKEYEEIIGALRSAMEDQSFSGTKEGRKNDIKKDLERFEPPVSAMVAEAAKAAQKAQADSAAATQAAQQAAAAQAQADAMKAQADALNELNQHLKAQNANQFGVGDPNHHFPPSSFDGGNA